MDNTHIVECIWKKEPVEPTRPRPPKMLIQISNIREVVLLVSINKRMRREKQSVKRVNDRWSIWMYLYMNKLYSVHQMHEFQSLELKTKECSIRYIFSFLRTLQFDGRMFLVFRCFCILFIKFIAEQWTCRKHRFRPLTTKKKKDMVKSNYLLI